MSKQEILNWTQRVEHDPEDEGFELPEFDWSKLHDDWPSFMEFAQKQITNSSTKLRIAFISRRLSPMALRTDLNLSQTMDLFKLVIMTLPRYVDAPSREAVLQLAVDLVRRDELRGKPEGEPDSNKMGVAEQIVGWLNVEANRVSKAAG
ncbi:hypothetical protein CPB86DRAFT_706324 [Serendipita vermifera]|nr:hypothetical protein CPB86DRAFT_706324 [Serendipita vermifera]